MRSYLHFLIAIALAIVVLMVGSYSAQAQRIIPLASQGATVYSGVSGVCLECTVSNTSAVINADLSDEALISLPVGVAASAYLGVRFPTEQVSGERVGFNLRNGAGLVDVTLLGGLSLTTYLNGQVRETAAGNQLRASRESADDQRSFVFFRPELTFDEIRLTVSGAVSLARDVRVAYAMHFVAITQLELDPLLAPEGASATAWTTGLCVGCGVQNVEHVVARQRALFATLYLPLGVTGAAHVSVDAGRLIEGRGRAGFRLGRGPGLIDATLLGGLRVATYRNGVEQEAASGRDLLIQFLNGEIRVASFETTQPYDEVRLTVAGVVSLAVDLEVYFAFSAIRVPRMLGADFVAFRTAGGEDRNAGGEDFDAEEFNAIWAMLDDASVLEEALTGAGTDPDARRTTPAGLLLSPNPTLGTSVVTFVLDDPADVRAVVYDALGREVGVLASGRFAAGAYRLRTPEGLAPGAYVVHVVQDGPDGRRVQRAQLTVSR